MEHTHALIKTVIAVSLFSLTACGGGSGGNNTLNPLTEPKRFIISGRITVAANIINDSDVNDPSSLLISNNTRETAQLVDNLTAVNGFLTHEPTNKEGDAFRFAQDRADTFRVSLQENQNIRMRIADFVDDGQSSIDLDLALFDLDLNLIAMSMSDTEFEAITVPADGEYLVKALSASGTSKYILEFSSNFSVAGNSMHNMPANWVLPNQAIVKQKAQNILSAKQSTTVQTKSNQANLVKFDFDNVIQKAARSLSPSLEELRRLNPESYKIYKTLQEIKKLQRDDSVEYASPNFIRKAMLIPNDEFFNLQWHYPAMNLPQAWDITTGTPASGNVIVAVIDTGVVLNHPELDEQLVPGFDFISDISNALDGDGIDSNPDDPGDSTILGQSSWHGTHVSGTIAAESDNNIGVAGVSFGAKIMPLRVLGARGGSSFDIVQALRFAAGLSNDSDTVPEQPADIINLSLGGPGSSQFEAVMYQDLFDLGIIVVAAAGNENTSALSFPASYPGVISVAALDAANQRAPYSNFGTQVDIAAPGGNQAADLTGDGFGDGILSTFINDNANDDTGERQATINFLQGTSMASPHIAGMFALMKAVHPELTAQQADTLLKAGSLTREAGDAGRDDIFGHGIADAFLAVQVAEQLANSADPLELPPSILATPSQIKIASNNTALLNINNVGGGTPTLIEIINPAEPWLLVSEESVDAKGFGSYRLTIDRSSLISGTYLVTLRFVFDDANELQVNVSTDVGNITENGKTSQLFVSLVDADSNIQVARILATQGSNNTFDYRFTDITQGDYLVYAGSDIDNDGKLCQTGEVCGGFPITSRISPINVDSDTSGIDIQVSTQSTFSPLTGVAN
jgi:serine protease